VNTVLALAVVCSGLRNEALTLTITVKDTSWHRLGRGNRAQIVRQLDLDSKPPVISVLSGQIAGHQDRGDGLGVDVEGQGEEAQKFSGLIGVAGEKVIAQPDAARDQLFVGAVNHQAGSAMIDVMLAGNESTVGFNFRPLLKKFRHDDINISDNFLQSKMGQFADLYPDATSPMNSARMMRPVLPAGTGEAAREARSTPRWVWLSTALPSYL